MLCNNAINIFLWFQTLFYIMYFALEIHGLSNKLLILKENFTRIIFFFHFPLIGLEWDSMTLFTKWTFFLPKVAFQHHLHKIYMAFYLLRWTQFNDVNGGRNILINFQLKRIFLWAATRKNETKLKKTKQHGKRK